ncbi:hypothetical protein Glove_382g38 [Diversispora epigaea]|uniref:HECT-type E3 ubiquitin transferase n=1 Tax=Diversispora epigaea TaxID=1348612 RepID=A0A397HBU3_9GLOM|nr:hypothetical protein Glove_382g38 [Diversispora epigaea]
MINSFNSFEGNYRPRRNINLGGQRKQEDLGSLIKKTQELRNDRSLERQRQKSATKIQAFYRGRTVAGRNRNQERALWDQQVEIIFNLDNSMYYAAKTLVNMARSFLFFYRPIYDNRREYCLCEILWKNNLNSEMIFIPFSYDELRATWTLQLKKILLIFLQSVGSQSIIDNNNYTIHYLKTLLLAVDLEKHERAKPTYGGREISQDLLEYLVKHDLYFELRKYLLNLNIEDKNDSAIMPIVNLGLYSFRIFNPEDETYKLSLRKFITDIFTIPLLSHRINIEALSILSSRMPLHNLIVMLSEMNGNNWNLEQGSVLLSNLLVFAHRTIKKMNKDVMLAYLKVIQNLLLLIPTRLLIDKPETDIIVNSDDDSDDEVIVQETTSSSPKIDPGILKGISYLFDSQHLISVFAFSKCADYKALLKISNFLMILINRWSSRKADLLHSIINGTLSMSENISSIRLLWEAFKNSDLARLLPVSQSLPINYFSEPSFSEQWGLFILLCELFSRILVTMGDDEFFNENQNPLKLSEIIEMSISLKNVGFTLYWNSPLFKMDSTIHGGCISFIYLREIATKLLRQIHARDSRRRFTAPDHWLMISESEMATFAKTVVAEDLELEKNQDGVNIDKRQLISISPRLGILYNIPFVIPFDERVKIFRNFVRNDRERIHDGFFEPRRRVTIRRNNIFEDGFAYLNSAGKGLKNSVAIQFIDEFGIPEAGIDGGGLFKEFLTSLTRIAFDTNYGLFLSTDKQLLYPNPHEYAHQETQLGYYEFIGRILGKALYEGILIDAAFAGFFLTKWLGRTSYLDDLPSLDPGLYQGLIILKNYQGNVESDFSLNFTAVDNEFGESRTIELKPGGSDIPVDQYNRLQYIYLVTNYRLNIQIEKQCKAFFRGLSDLINSKWLKMFNQQELQILVGGAYIPIDFEDLRQNTVYSDYKDDDPVIQSFWKVVSEFSEEEKRNLIKFVTSCSRPPLFGFKELNPKFSIRRAGSGIRLPSSSTCVNLLKLPAYPDENTLREKLMYAINADVGFDLS